MILRSKTTSEAFLSLLGLFDQMLVNSHPRGLPCRELLNAVTVVDEPDEGAMQTASISRNERMARYLAAEFNLYESGEDRVEAYAQHAKFWRGVTDGDRVNSAYGRIVFFDHALPDAGKGGLTPWQWAKRALLDDPDTRQAVVQYLQPRHYQANTKDFVCTTHGVFHIRSNQLHYTVTMRSNDLVRGFSYDVPWHCRCQLRMLKELQAEAPEVFTNLQLGSYTHITHSLHTYDRDKALVKEMLGT